MDQSGSVKKANKNYKAMNRTAAEDKNLSWKAKGVMFYFLSKPDKWEGHMYDLLQNGKGGKNALQSAINELKKAGYIETIARKKNGKFTGKHYRIHDEKIKIKAS